MFHLVTFPNFSPGYSGSTFSGSAFSGFPTTYAQIPLDGSDQTLSETQVYDLVSDLVSDKVRLGPLRSPTSSRTLSGRRHFCAISTCTDFVRGSGRVADKVRGSV